MTDRDLRFAAPAKINLYLHVVGRRTDGYHLLDSLIAFAGIGDTVAVAPAGDISLTLEGPYAGTVPDGPDNLVVTAARRLAEASAAREGAAITLVKRLPPASGIGGGSADAAATLRALVRLWGLDSEAVDLAGIAAALGADVPVCLAGRSAFIGGIGEQLLPAPALPRCWLVLANPGVALSTPEVFAARQGPFSQPDLFDGMAADPDQLALRLGGRRNDLSQAAIGLCPAIGEVLEALEEQPGTLLARMSGSGATCFALFAEAAQAEAAAESLSASRPAWWVAAAPMVCDVETMPGDGF